MTESTTVPRYEDDEVSATWLRTTHGLVPAQRSATVRAGDEVVAPGGARGVLVSADALEGLVEVCWQPARAA